MGILFIMLIYGTNPLFRYTIIIIVNNRIMDKEREMEMNFSPV